MSRPASGLLDCLPATLSQQLKDHARQVLLEIIWQNSASQFAQNAPVLAKFRESVAQRDSMDDIEFLRNFQELVPITSYESYEPFVVKLYATPCREVDVKDVLSPGLSCFLAITNATSGKEPRVFARCRPPSQHVWHPIYLTIPSSEGTVLAPSSSRYLKVLNIDREDGQSSQELVVCSLSSGFLWTQMNWNPGHDLNRLDLLGKYTMSFPIIHANPEATPVPGQTAPFALTIVENYRSFFILHALFALADPRVTTMCFLFVNVFAIMLQFIEDEWPLLVDCIENGVIPHLENIDLLRGVLEVGVC
jgi:hypothetical protein